MSYPHEAEHNAAVDRRTPPTNSATILYVAAVIVLSLLGVGAIVALTVLNPEKDHSSTIVVILGFLVPTVTALLAGAVSQVQKSVNGRLTQLLAMTARTHAAEGEIVGQAKAAATIAAMPEVTIAKVVPAAAIATAVEHPPAPPNGEHQR